MKKTIVVGGGIVGITAAFFAKKKGYDVILIEASDRLGGLLKSDCSDNGCFDYGTHIASMTGIDELDEFLFSDFSILQIMFSGILIPKRFSFIHLALFADFIIPKPTIK